MRTAMALESCSQAIVTQPSMAMTACLETQHTAGSNFSRKLNRRRTGSYQQQEQDATKSVGAMLLWCQWCHASRMSLFWGPGNKYKDTRIDAQINIKNYHFTELLKHWIININTLFKL